MAGDLGVTNQRDKGREGEIYITQEVCKLGYKALYVGGCQRYTIDGTRFDCVDILIWKSGKVAWLQAKNKQPRTKYPDTGMALYQYGPLLKHEKETGIPVLVLFTDKSRAIYGEWLKNLPKCVSTLGNQYNYQDGYDMVYWLTAKLKDYKLLLSLFQETKGT